MPTRGHYHFAMTENFEPLVDLKSQDTLAFGPSPEVPNNIDYTKVRRSVYEKLVQAQKILPGGLKLCLYEGYRSPSLQELFFNTCYSEIKKRYPTWEHKEIFLETTKFVAPVANIDGSLNIPPHSTGGAVDVYLIYENGDIVDMGINLENCSKDFNESIFQTNSNKISEQARKHRNIMSSVLTEVDFVNYPTEYWHWSYGDRYWAYKKRFKYAYYGMVK